MAGSLAAVIFISTVVAVFVTSMYDAVQFERGRYGGFVSGTAPIDGAIPVGYVNGTTAWVTGIHALHDADRDTRVATESAPGSDEDTITMHVDGMHSATFHATQGLTLHQRHNLTANPTARVLSSGPAARSLLGLEVANTSSASLVLEDAQFPNPNTLTLCAPPDHGGDFIYEFPAVMPTAGQVLSAATAPTVDGVVPLQWVTDAAGLVGTGTANTLTKWASAASLADSVITDDGTNVAVSPSGTLTLTAGVATVDAATIKLAPAVAPVVGQVWTATNVDGSGNWQTVLHPVPTGTADRLAFFDSSGDLADSPDLVYDGTSTTLQSTYVHLGGVNNFVRDPNSAKPGVLHLREPSSFSGDHAVGLSGPSADMAAGYLLEFPATVPTAGQVLEAGALSGGAYPLSWATPGSGGPGTGTVNTLPKWATGTTLGDSSITDDGTVVLINADLDVTGTDLDIGGSNEVFIRKTGGSASELHMYPNGDVEIDADRIYLQTGTSGQISLKHASYDWALFASFRSHFMQRSLFVGGPSRAADPLTANDAGVFGINDGQNGGESLYFSIPEVLTTSYQLRYPQVPTATVVGKGLRIASVTADGVNSINQYQLEWYDTAAAAPTGTPDRLAFFDSSGDLADTAQMQYVTGSGSLTGSVTTLIWQSSGESTLGSTGAGCGIHSSTGTYGNVGGSQRFAFNAGGTFFTNDVHNFRGTTASVAGSVGLTEATNDGGSTLTLQAPDLTASYTVQLPASIAGAAGQHLTVASVGGSQMITQWEGPFRPKAPFTPPTESSGALTCTGSDDAFECNVSGAPYATSLFTFATAKASASYVAHCTSIDDFIPIRVSSLTTVGFTVTAQSAVPTSNKFSCMVLEM